MGEIAWDEWRGSFDGRPSMFIKRLLAWRGWRVDLHKFVRADDPACFHTHPAYALRIVLWGGYVEQIDGTPCDWREWAPGAVGIVAPELCHRISALRRGPSYSLWIRAPKSAEIEIRGSC